VTLQGFEQAADMHFDRPMAKSQCVGDLFVGLALSDQAQHFDLSGRHSTWGYIAG